VSRGLGKKREGAKTLSSNHQLTSPTTEKWSFIPKIQGFERLEYYKGF